MVIEVLLLANEWEIKADRLERDAAYWRRKNRSLSAADRLMDMASLYRKLAKELREEAADAVEA